MDQQLSLILWKNIPHLPIGQIPDGLFNNSTVPMRLVIAKRTLLAASEEEEDYESSMIDVVSDMRHLAAHLGLDFESILRSSEENFRKESAPRHMPGHYHLEFQGEDGNEDEDDEDRFFNASLEDCAEEIRLRPQRLVNAGFSCKFGCGQLHSLNDNELAILGVSPTEFFDFSVVSPDANASACYPLGWKGVLFRREDTHV